MLEAREMGNTSKDLLCLEHKNSSSSSLDSTLFVCKRDSQSQNKKKLLPNGKPITTPLPTSQVLGKVRDFLGVISEANERLQLDVRDNSCEDHNIEVLSGNESEYIEMDLMLGVADLHTPEALAAAESAIAGSQPIIPLAADGSETESEEDSDDENDDEDDSDDNDSNINDRKACSAEKTKRTKAAEDLSLSKASGSRQSKKRPKIVELS